ncbi:MAG: phosphatase PAP2 family protein [Roseburia sp.]|uniref:phosphatase PAP2 family protein n=1 Tax=Roseburia sp. 831b TaxID=1261635 RepID=UPI0009525E4A|nr:phosphatase PAP2 family protein [Roseburia sp. 831b]MCI5919261.1 phosphatase PAP2 family protein [Roseburia sp.]MDD6215510.1 phosphatase PAP2 family protein [Roseburia sp.]WVK71747.1 phosphatase PAP2 family protein [Roseburia sp. 831b]
MLHTLWQIDAGILLWIQDNVRNDFLTPIMKFITKTGNIGFIWIFLTVAFLCFQKTRKTGTLMACSLGGAFVINNLILKNLVARTRPYEVIDGLHLMVPKAVDLSFPSGHTGSSFATAVVMFIMLPKKYGVPALIYAFLMGFSRLYIGIHYPTDVLCGGIIGTLVAITVCTVYKKKFQTKE